LSDSSKSILSSLASVGGHLDSHIAHTNLIAFGPILLVVTINVRCIGSMDFVASWERNWILLDMTYLLRSLQNLFPIGAREGDVDVDYSIVFVFQ
jgi:hypothetical protein